MKRNVLLALFAALALAVSFGSVASAGTGENAQASAKKGKGKGCKGKKGKGKAKGQTSAAASAKGKAKGKCKGKGKGPKPKPEPVPLPAPPTPAPPPPSNWPLSDGTYEDAGANVTLLISGGGTQAEAKFSGPSTCFPFAIGLGQGPVTSTATSMQANAGHDGGSVRGKWAITVQSNLSYELVTDSATEFPDTTPCSKTGVVFTGTLTKAG